MQYEMRTGLFLAPFFPRYFHKAQTNDHLQLLRPQVECALRASKLEDIVEKNLLSCFSYSTADFQPGIVPRHIKIQLRPTKPMSCLPGPSWSFLSLSLAFRLPLSSLKGPFRSSLGNLYKTHRELNIMQILSLACNGQRKKWCVVGFFG